MIAATSVVVNVTQTWDAVQPGTLLEDFLPFYCKINKQYYFAEKALLKRCTWASQTIL